MKKYLIYILIILLLNIGGYSTIHNDSDDIVEYYRVLSQQEKINSILTIQDAITWFKNHTDNSYAIVKILKDKKYVKYSFKDKKKTIINLDFIYDSDNKCSQIFLQMNVNGSQKTYYNDDAKKVLIMLLSYNEEFEYYQKD